MSPLNPTEADVISLFYFDTSEAQRKHMLAMVTKPGKGSTVIGKCKFLLIFIELFETICEHGLALATSKYIHEK